MTFGIIAPGKLKERPDGGRPRPLGAGTKRAPELPGARGEPPSELPGARAEPPSELLGAGVRPPSRRLRADAMRNVEKVLRAAEEVFAKEGLGVPVDQVARRAGVGVGTIYRHFPTKEALVEAIVASRVQEFGQHIRELKRGLDPAEALFAYLSELVALGAQKRDFMEQLARAGIHSEGLHAAKATINRSLSTLLKRAQAAGTVRKDLTTADLSSLVMGVCAAACERKSPEASQRLLSVLRAGLSTKG